MTARQRLLDGWERGRHRADTVLTAVAGSIADCWAPAGYDALGSYLALEDIG